MLLSYLMTTNLAPRKRRDPGHSQVDGNVHDTHDPDDGVIIGAIVAEDDGENDTTEVTGGTNHTRKHAIGVRMDVRYKSKVGTVAGLVEESHACNETNHGRKVLWVELADDDQEDT